MESSLRKQLEMDDDDYWNQSSKFKRIFDDDEQSKKSRNLFDDDDDDDTERVDWAGDTISFSQLSAESARYRYPVKAKGDPPAPTLKPKGDSFPTAAKSEAINDKISLADAVIRTDSSPQPLKRESNLGTATEAAKLKAELNFQKRRANEAELSRWTSLPVDDTIKRILSGEVYTLETYKSLDEKLSLLDAAIQSRDGNALTAVVVFFHGSVKNNIFLTQMKSRPVALNHYLQYLRKTSRIPELIEAFGMFALHEEAAILKLNFYVMNCVGFFKSEWVSIRTNAVVCAGFLLGNLQNPTAGSGTNNNVAMHKSSISKEHVCSALMSLLKDSDPGVRSAAAEAISLLHSY